MIQPFCPVDVRVLDATRAQFAIRSMLDKPARILALASKSRAAQLGLAAFFTALQGDGHAVQLYTDIPTNPTVDDVVALLARLREEPFEPTVILAIGGGSCMDLGKAAGALYHLVRKPDAAAVRAAIADRAYAAPHMCIDLLAMPTTAGTGSEVTRWATVWDTGTNRKLSVDHAQGFPKAAVLVPEWTLHMPAALTLATGLDALSHAMEAYWAVARNPLSQEMALMAAAKICRALPLALSEPDHLDARREMCLASLTAGLAFTQTRTTACHSISYPLTLHKGIPHGFAVAVTLSSVMRRNAKAVPEMERLQGVFDEAEGFDAWLEQTAHGVQTLTLSAFGIAEQELEFLARQTFTAGRMDNNPVAFTTDDVLEILHENL